MKTIKSRFGSKRVPEELPIYIATDAITADSRTDDIRPPAGTIWELVYASIRLNQAISFVAGGVVRFKLQMTDGTTTVIIRQDAERNGDTRGFEDINVEISSLGVAPIILTNNRYMQMESTKTAGTSALRDHFAIVRVI